MSIYANVSESEVSQPGQVPAGVLFVSIKNTGASDALVNGVPLEAGQAKSYPFLGKPYTAIDYDPQGSSLRILHIL